VAGGNLPAVHGAVVSRPGGGAVTVLDAVVVAYTARSGEHQELRLARVALPEADH